MSVVTILACFCLVSGVAFAQESEDSLGDHQCAETSSEKREAINSYINSLEESYACQITVASILEMTEAMLVSVIGRGSACQGAIDSLQKKFESMSVVIDGKIVGPDRSESDRIYDKDEPMHQDLIHEINPKNGN